MSGLFDRIKQAMGGTDRAHPGSQVEVSDDYAQQTELLRQVRQGAAAVAGSRKQIGAQITRLTREIDSLTVSAHRALEAGREPLAREVLARRLGLSDQVAELEAQHDALGLEEEKLVLTSTRLQAKLDSIRTKQQTVWATASADEARARVDEALAAMSTDLGHAGQAVQAAHDRATASLGSLKAADDLLAAPPAEPTVDADAALGQRVALEVDAIKAELASRGQPETGQGAYQQPGESGPGRVQDARILEPGGPRPAEGE